MTTLNEGHSVTFVPFFSFNYVKRSESVIFMWHGSSAILDQQCVKAVCFHGSLTQSPLQKVWCVQSYLQYEYWEELKGKATLHAGHWISCNTLKRICFHQWLVLRGALCDILRHSCGKAFTKSGSTDLRQSLSKVICTLSSWRYQVHCINRVMLTSSFVCSRNSMDFILDHIFLYASCTGSANLDRGLDFCSYPKAWHHSDWEGQQLHLVSLP